MKIGKNFSIKTDKLKVSLAVVIIGIGAGVFSFLFHESIAYATHLIGTDKTFTIESYLYAVMAVTISYFLTKYIFKDTHGSGIPQVKLSLAAYKGKMPKRMPFGKFITSFFTLCSGLSFGKEGPMVTISAAWGHLVSRVFNLSRQTTKVLVSSGATAGLAAAFNTPIAAVVFTIEEILGELNTKYLGPIIVTAVIASVTSFKLLGNHSTFIDLKYGFHIEWHLIFYLLLGLTMSLVGIMFVNMTLFMKSIRQKIFKGYDLMFILVIMTLTAFASYLSPNILGDGVGTINTLLLGDIEGFGSGVLKTILLIFILKLVLSTFSYSTGLSGGLFMPVLFLGAVGGAAFGLMVQGLGVEKIEIGVFALLGMTSLLVAVIRTPFTAFVMLFEMTKDYDLILPLMTSSIAAYWLSTYLNPESVYESVAEYEGVHLPTTRDNECLTEMEVEECMVRDVITLNSKKNVLDLKELIESHNVGGYPVLENGKLVGVLNRCDIRKKIKNNEDILVKDMLKHSTISIYPDQSLLVALDRMKRFEISRLPVVSRFNDKQLLGIVTPEDIINYLGLSKSDEDDDDL